MIGIIMMSVRYYMRYHIKPDHEMCVEIQLNKTRACESARMHRNYQK